MSEVGRMDLDTARGQQKQVATALHVLTALVLCVASVFVVSAASMRAQVQDESLEWLALASRYLKQSEMTDAGAQTDYIRLASQYVESSPLEGAVLVERSLDDLGTFDPASLATATDFTRQLDCLAEAVYYEARSEPFVGQLAVAQVVMNRVRHSAYPDTLCGVVYEGSERRTGCQFSFTCDGSLYREPRGRAWARAHAVAQHAFMGFGRDVTRTATHYHTVAVDPHWNDSLVRTRRIGTHIFYRFPTRRERAAGVVRNRDA